VGIKMSKPLATCRHFHGARVIEHISELFHVEKPFGAGMLSPRGKRNRESRLLGE
jgi:hypothetical protein